MLRLTQTVLMLGLTLLALGPFAVHPAAAASLTFAVNSTADAPDALPGDGVCATATGQCTLRAAIQETNAQPGGSTITILVPGGTYVLTLGTLALTANTIALSGAGPRTTVNGDGSQVFAISSGVRAIISHVTITGGNAGQQGYGGGVLNAGQLTLGDSVVRGNTAIAGGGLANSGGRLTVIRSLISGNTALAYGGGGIQNGGIQNLAGTVTVLTSTVEGNQPGGGDGGGILNGQNGHPAGTAGRAVATRAYCTQTPRCDPAADSRTRPSSAHTSDASGTGPSTLPLTLTVVDSRIRNNGNANAGGGIANDGGNTLVLHSTLSGNTTRGLGGGISTYGHLTVIESVLSHNTAASGGRGGAIEAFYGGIPGDTTVISSTLSDNTATSYGGGIDVSGLPLTMTLSGSTLSGNTAVDGGGGIENEGSSMTLFNSTLSGNTSALGGGGIETYACGGGTLSYVTLAANSSGLALSCSDVALRGTIVATSRADANCSGALPAEAGGYNLDSGASCGFSQTTDITNTNPLLGPLANNGGPTQTMALLPGSPATDHGGTSANGCPATDQRGLPRPDEAADNGACDIGAYE